MTHRLAIRFIAVALALVLFAGTGIVGQSNPQVRKEDRPVIGVYFDEPLKLLEPFDKDFRRSCTCVENAFALIPRIVPSPMPMGGGSVVPLRPGPAVLRLIRDVADARWRDPVTLLGDGLTPRMLITGRGVPPLDREAAIVAGVEGYWQLGQRGQSDAQAELGYLFAVGLGVPQNDEWAAYWYGQAALQDWPDAKLALAAMYAIGRGVPQDDRAAAYWLFRSQNLHLIADAYACGFGVEQDFEYARELYEMMADRGSADAQYQLGNMYVNVCGAPLNDDLASKWFQKAADAGHPEAQIALSEMMSRGWTRGIPDPWQAYVWVELALTRLPDEGPPRTRALAARDRARAMLSPEQQADVAWLLRTMLDTEAELQAEALKSLQSSLVEVLK